MTIFGWSVAFSQFYIPLPIVHTICGSGPIFIFIIDFYLNGIRINSKQFFGIIIGIIGLILTINGRILLVYINPTFEMESEFENYRT